MNIRVLCLRVNNWRVARKYWRGYEVEGKRWRAGSHRGIYLDERVIRKTREIGLLCPKSNYTSRGMERDVDVHYSREKNLI